VGWNLAIGVFLIGITRERRLKPSSLDLMGGGGISPCLNLWRGTCPCWLSLMNGDLGSTRILTRHCGASSRSWEPRRLGKSLLFSPSGLSKHLWTGSVCMPHHLLTTRAEPWGIIKMAAQNKAVRMKRSLCLSFHLSGSLGGYTVGTTMGFCVATMEDLALWPHHRIPRWHP
jgi:hypothetical protein